MSWISRWFGKGGDTVTAGIQSGGPNTNKVKFDDAMTVSAFWAAIRLLSETVGSMPIKCYKKNEEGDFVEDTEYQLWRLLNYFPNRYQTRVEFFENLMLNLSTRGNAYFLKEKNAGGEYFSFMPLPSAQVEPELSKRGDIVYRYTDANSVETVFTSDQIWHIKIFGNAIKGLTPLQYMAQALGIARDLSDRTSALAANGGKTSGVLSTDKSMNAEQKQSIRKSFASLSSGNENSLIILDQGLVYQQTSLSPTDQQLLESRRFSIEDIARFVGVPSVLINDTSSSTTWGSGIAEINQGFYKLNLRPYLERIEASIMRHLMPRGDWGVYSIKFDFDELLKLNRLDRMEANSRAINSGQMTPNEARANEGLRAKPGGDKILVNSTLVPAEIAGQMQATKVPTNGS